MKNNNIIEELDSVIKKLERKKNKPKLLVRIINDLQIDAYNLEKYFEIERNKKK